MRLALGLLLCLLPHASFATPDLTPPPRGHWAKDTTGKISAATLSQLDAIAQRVEDSGAGQLGVCITSTTSGQVPRTFATSLFNRWGIGHAGANDGLLLFVALTDRKAEIVLGSGSKVTSSQTDVVMANDVVANFKRGQVDQGLISAAEALAELMTAQAPNVVTPTAQVDDELMPFVRKERAFPERSPRSWVLDLSNQVSASARAELDLIANDLYAESKGRLFFLIVELKGSQPSLTNLAQALQTQVRPLSNLPLGIVAWDKTSGQLLLLVPEKVTASSWEASTVAARQDWLANLIDNSAQQGLLEAGQYVAELLVREIGRAHV
jgi:uncharacterized membrane protein YgcG